jgi:hypothetical protein
MLWVSGVWDGPITGVAERRATRYWFAARFDKAADEWEFPRRLFLYEITDDEFREESELHARFERIVGNLTYCFHLPPQERINASADAGRRTADFYEDERNKRRRDYDARPVAGWFSPPKRTTVSRGSAG